MPGSQVPVHIANAHFPLGKRPPRHDPRTLHLANYLPRGLQSIRTPLACWWGRLTPSWPMLANDQVGNCTIAGSGHMIQNWTRNTRSQPTLMTDAEAIQIYSTIGGYVPGDPSTDNGCVALDVLNYWRKTGIIGHKIAAYAALEPKNVEHAKLATFLFGGPYLGVSLPKTAQGQAVWSVPPCGLTGDGTPGSWGGHCVPVTEYDENYLYVVSWGMVIPVTYAFYVAYCDESYAVLSDDWLRAEGVAPVSAFNMDQLQADLALVAA